MKTIIVTLSCVCTLLVRPAFGCVVVELPGAPPLPTAESIVRDAEVIVVSKPLRYLREPISYELSKAAGNERLQFGLVQFRVESTLKGDLADDTLTVEGYLSEKDDFNDFSVPYQVVRWSGQHRHVLRLRLPDRRAALVAVEAPRHQPEPVLGAHDAAQ